MPTGRSEKRLIENIQPRRSQHWSTPASGSEIEVREVATVTSSVQVSGQREVSGFSVRVSARLLACVAHSLSEHETEVVQEGKSQITSTKFQINLKSQYQMTKTHCPHRKGNMDSGSTIQDRYKVLDFQSQIMDIDLRNPMAERPLSIN